MDFIEAPSSHQEAKQRAKAISSLGNSLEALNSSSKIIEDPLEKPADIEVYLSVQLASKLLAEALGFEGSYRAQGLGIASDGRIALRLKVI